MKKAGLFSLALAVTMATTGCYGPFNLTKKIHSWNGDVGSKWVNEAAFLGLALLPVYGFAMLADAVVFNSIEFWGGENPISAKKTKSVQDGDKQTVFNYNPATKRLRVDSFEKGRPAGTVVFYRDAQGRTVARDGDGELLARAKAEGTLVSVTDASGKTIGRYTSEDLLSAYEAAR